MKFFKVVAGIVLLLLMSVVGSPSVSALSFSNSYSSGIKSNSYAYWAGGYGFTQFVQQGDGGYFPTKASQLYRTDVCFTSNIQPNSLVSFTVTFPTSAVNTWSGFAPYNTYSLLFKSSYTAADYVNETYLLYTHSGDDCVALSAPNPDSFVGVFKQSDALLRFSGVGVAVLDDGTTDYSSNLSALLEQLTNANTNLAIINSNISNVLSQLKSSSQAQTDAINDLKDQEQQHWDDENNTTTGSQDSAETDADSAVSDTETATASLFDVITSVVGAITNASATNCNIDMSSLPLGLGTVDICDFPVPTFITVIGSILAIVILVPIALSVLRDIIGLLESFTR